MNEIRFTIVVILAAALLGGCSAHSDQPTPEATPPLAGATIGGPFTLTDQDGHQVSDTSFAGKYRIMYFGYTYCPDVCPTDMQHLGAAMRLLDRDDPMLSERIVPIFVTVDPDRDTPAVLKQFVSAFYPRLIGLTGSTGAIARVAREYRVFYQKQPPMPGGGYLVQHNSNAYLMSPDNQPLALLPVDGPPGPIAATIEQWAK